ncbi:MAG: MoxR family ATPase [Pirellulaceae bacterium]|nr:MoxR family ATPase [Pirellulaceae bacterium]
MSIDTPPDFATTHQQLERLRGRLNQVLIGKSQKIEMVLACLLAQGHLLLDDLPGTGKTTLAKAVAQLFGAKFSRVQCTPDLLPTDVTGFNLFNQKTREFEFRPGPVFADILLADELNRTTPRTQSALFEAMAERQVTLDGLSRPLSSTFFVMATQNPIDSHGAYPLPEAQLDRFAMRLEIGYPDTAAQLAILAQARQTHRESTAVEPILSLDQLAQLQEEAAGVHVDLRVQEYLVALCERTRHDPMVALGVSPRGMLLWQRVAQSWAMLHGRDFVTPEDIQTVAPPVLGVRLVCRGPNQAQTIETILSSVEVPTYR